MAQSRVAVLKTRPETALEDYGRLVRLAGIEAALDPRADLLPRRSLFSSLKRPITPSSAVFTFTACTAPKNSPMNPVMIPVARLLARRYSSMRVG